MNANKYELKRQNNDQKLKIPPECKLSFFDRYETKIDEL